MAFDKDTYCSYCNMPGAKHSGGVQIEGQNVSGIFCNKSCFDKWVLWKAAFIRALLNPVSEESSDAEN